MSANEQLYYGNIGNKLKSIQQTFLRKAIKTSFEGAFEGSNYEHWERIITSMKSIIGLSSMLSLGTLVEIRELHLELSWEHIGSKHDKDMNFHF